MHPAKFFEHLLFVGLGVKSLEIERWSGQNAAAELREECGEAGWCEVMDVWDPRVAQRSVKTPAEKGHLSWSWETKEFASLRNEGSKSGSYSIYKDIEERLHMVIGERPWKGV